MFRESIVIVKDSMLAFSGNIPFKVRRAQKPIGTNYLTPKNSREEVCTISGTLKI